MDDIELMTPDHPRWDEFANALAEAINAQEAPGVSDCKHDFSSTQRILADMGGFDVEETLAFFEENGGYCDCEVLINVDPGSPEDGLDEDIPAQPVAVPASPPAPSKPEPDMRLHICKSQMSAEGIVGTELRKELEGLPHLGEEDLDRLLAEDAFPDEWIGRNIFFWRNPRIVDGREFIPLAYWSGKWRKSLKPITDTWGMRQYAALKKKEERL